MLDKASVLTTLFPRVDDTMKESAVIQHTIQRPGPVPQHSDSEVMTLALYQELPGEPREDHFLRLHHESLRSFFPGRNERSRYNRRKRDLWSVILALRMSLPIVIESLAYEATAVIDSAPVPCVGYKRSKQHRDFLGFADYGICSSKALKYFGCKVHCVVSLTGVIMSFLLTSATTYDHQPVVELLDSFEHHLTHVLGDGTYNDADLQQFLKHTPHREVLAPVKVNQPPVRSRLAQQQLNRLRLMCETGNAQLQEPLHVSKHSATSIQGLRARIAATLTAHSVGMMVNAFGGHPALNLADLAV